MAAGRGTRLAPFTDILPKPVIPVANEPVMGHLLRMLARHGMRDVICNIHYKADIMKAVFNDGSAYGVDLRFSEEDELLGTAGGVKNVQSFLTETGDTCIVMSGDGLHDVDLNKLIQSHRASGARATMALAHVSDPSEYGVAILDEDSFITGFQEKPARDEALSNLCNTGIYVFERSVLDLIPQGEFYDFGNDLFPLLLAHDRALHGVVIDGYWNDIGSLDSYRAGNLAAVEGEVGNLPDRDDEWPNDVLVAASARVYPDAVVTGPGVVGPDARIEQGAVVTRSVVLPGTTVPSGAIVAAGVVADAPGLEHWLNTLST